MEESRVSKLSVKQTVDVANAIGANGIAFDNNTFRYNAGWSDARIAIEIIPEYNGNGSNAVGNVRRKIYGNFAPGEKNTHSNDIESKIKDIQEYCVVLSMRLNQCIDYINSQSEAQRKIRHMYNAPSLYRNNNSTLFDADGH